MSQKGGGENSTGAGLGLCGGCLGPQGSPAAFPFLPVLGTHRHPYPSLSLWILEGATAPLLNFTQNPFFSLSLGARFLESNS